MMKKKKKKPVEWKDLKSIEENKLNRKKMVKENLQFRGKKRKKYI